MYSVIERHHEQIISTITSKDVNTYDWLIENREQPGSEEYQRQFKSFWGMNVARLGSSFYSAYFDAFQRSLVEAALLGNLCRTLYEAYLRRDGKQTLQFSFATKLLHMINPRVPIYDSRIAMFFLFQEPSTDLAPPDRIEKYIGFHDFLAREYERVISGGHLADSISAFRRQFNPRQHTDEKIIDWLIWAFVGLIGVGALADGTIAYE